MYLRAGMGAAIAFHVDRCGIVAGMCDFMPMMVVCFMDMGIPHVRFCSVGAATLHRHRAGAHRGAIRLQRSARQKPRDQNYDCCDPQSYFQKHPAQL